MERRQLWDTEVVSSPIGGEGQQHHGHKHPQQMATSQGQGWAGSCPMEDDCQNTTTLDCCCRCCGVGGSSSSSSSGGGGGYRPYPYSEPYGTTRTVGKVVGKTSAAAAGDWRCNATPTTAPANSSRAVHCDSNNNNNSNNNYNNNNSERDRMLAGGGGEPSDRAAVHQQGQYTHSFDAGSLAVSPAMSVQRPTASKSPSWTRSSRSATLLFLLIGLLAQMTVAQVEEEDRGPVGGPLMEGARRGGPFSGPLRRGNSVDMASLENGPLTLRNGQLRPVAALEAGLESGGRGQLRPLPTVDEDLESGGRGRGGGRPLMLDREFFPPDFNFRNQFYNNLRRKDDGNVVMVDENGDISGGDSGGPQIHLTRLPPSQNFENSQNFHEDNSGINRPAVAIVSKVREHATTIKKISFF